MRAVGITRFGGPEVLEIVELPVPEPGPGPGADPGGGSDREPADTVLRSGGTALAPPYVPGMELAGIIDAADPGSGWQAGSGSLALTGAAGAVGGYAIQLAVGCRAAGDRTPRPRTPARSAAWVPTL